MLFEFGNALFEHRQTLIVGAISCVMDLKLRVVAARPLAELLEQIGFGALDSLKGFHLGALDTTDGFGPQTLDVRLRACPQALDVRLEAHKVRLEVRNVRLEV